MDVHAENEVFDTDFFEHVRIFGWIAKQRAQRYYKSQIEAQKKASRHAILGSSQYCMLEMLPLAASLEPQCCETAQNNWLFHLFVLMTFWRSATSHALARVSGEGAEALLAEGASTFR